MAERLINVGMAEIHALRTHAQYRCSGMGSCVGVCALDPVSGISGVVRILLPEMPKEGSPLSPGTFADTGVSEMIARMLILGAEASRIRVAIVGGAKVVKFGSEASQAAQLGDRNVQTVQREAERLGLTLVKSETGGNLGRSILFDTATGVIHIRTVNQGEHELCTLQEAA